MFSLVILSNLEMAHLKELCVCIIVASNWGGNATKTSEMFEVFFWREDTSFENLSKFESGVTFVEDAEYFGMSIIDHNK
jgi:hypothetical protein